MRLFISLVLFSLPALTPIRAGAGEREVVMLILVDAMRPDHLGCYGYHRPTSPVMDALAARGTRYTRVYANAPWTRSSTACFLTGLHASRHRTETDKSKLPPDVVSLAQRLKKAGWKTSGFSANGNGGSMAGLDRGFDVFEDPTNTYLRKGRKERCREKFGKTIEPGEKREAVLSDCVRYNRLPTGEFLVHRVLDHLKRSGAGREFVFVFLVDPHDPYGAPPELERRFLGKDFKGKVRRRALWEYKNDYPEKERFSMQAVYDASILYADQAIGQLTAGLDELGLAENATLLITADHGEGFGEHGFYLHAYHFWDEVVRIPLIAVGPRFGKKVDRRLTQSLDISATILDLAGLDPGDLPGSSLLGPPPENRPIISEYNEFGVHRQAILNDRWKVIWQRPADREWFMRRVQDPKYLPSVVFDREVVRAYDLKNDPQEKKAISPPLPDPAEALLKKLRAFVATAPQQPENR